MGRDIWKKHPEAHGEFPSVMFRIFDREQYALDFAEKGLVRFGSLKHYCYIDDASRRDTSEGDGHVRFRTEGLITAHLDRQTLKPVGQTVGPGIMNLSSTFVNPTYILCCSAPPQGDVLRLPKHFGNWAVRIPDPRAFAQRITDHLLKIGELDFPVESVRVRYRRSELLDCEPVGPDRNVLAYGYKAPSFASEHEFRLVLICSPSSVISSVKDGYWHIDVGGPICGAEVIKFDGAAIQ